MPRISKAVKNENSENKIEESVVNVDILISDNTLTEVNEVSTVITKRRGRRSKKEMLELQIQKELLEKKSQENGIVNENSLKMNDDTTVIPKKKGRKSHKQIEEEKQKEQNVDINEKEEQVDNENNEDVQQVVTKAPLKKRGRKPKGGKVIQQVLPNHPNVETKKNVIMHLKCSLKDLENYGGNGNVYPFNGESIGSTNLNKSNILDTFSYEVLRNNASENYGLSLIQDNSYYKQDNETTNNELISNKETPIRNNTQTDILTSDLTYRPLDNEISIKYKLIDLEEKNLLNEEHTTLISTTETNKNEILIRQQEMDKKETNKKLKLLEQRLHKSQMNDKKSACFWCTYEFDNPTIYIPKHTINEKHYVYGCFCSPECAVAHLMEEKIDTSVKFERYALLNHMYSKVYGYEKNIKPAPNPHYLLDKYFGNLNIQEYRSLFRKERLFLVIDKPLTHVLPELLEDNDDYFINNMIIPSNNNTQQNKKSASTSSGQKKKSGIISEKFCL